MKPSLHIGYKRTAAGEPFALPLELVTQSIAILAKRGAGKTYTAAVFAEEFQGAGIPTVILDPTGAHWGLKASANGKQAGLPFVVFGGEHSDLPLEEGSGEVIARAIVENRFPAILDMSLLRKGAMHRFLVGFLETIYRLNREAVHLICDEADVYAPQKPFGEEARTLGAMQDIVRRGRIRGLGCTLITQRPQVLNKDVLTQCEVLVALRLVHPKDIGAIKEWIEVHGDMATAREMVASLPSLPIGSAWFWSPGFGDIFERIQVRVRRTFDSSSTPKPGEARVSPVNLAQVDITKLGADIAATAARAKADDPKELRKEIQRLTGELAKKPVAAATAAPVEVLVLSDEHAERLKALERRGEEVIRLIEALGGTNRDFVAEMRTLRAEIGLRLGATKVVAPTVRPMPIAPPVSRAPIAARPSASGPSELMSKAERAILSALAQFGGCTKNKLAAVTGYSVGGGGFNNAISALRNKPAGPYITSGEPLSITSAGAVALGEFEPLPTGDVLRSHWLGRLDKAQRSIMEVLFRAYPTAMGKEMLAVEAGYEASGGGFNNALSALRTLELITRGSEIRASENLFA